MWLLILLGHFLFAGEPDNMMARATGASAEYANEAINQVVNATIEQRLQDYNYLNRSCNPDKLYKFMEDDLDRNFPRIYNSSILNVPIAGPVTYKNLPYKDLPRPEGVCGVDVGGFLPSPYNERSYAPSVKVKAKGKTFFIGLDKIDHFFAHGYYYWTAMGDDVSLPKEKMQRMLDLGIAQENGIWGLKCYSVKSYADLSANYHGIAFWKDLLKGSPPLIACENGKYVQKRKFDIANYIDASLDESINCNSYASAKVLLALQKEWSVRKLKCPADENTCAELRKSLPADVAAKILHPLCLGTGSEMIEKSNDISTQDYVDAVRILTKNKVVEPREQLKSKKATQ